MNHRLDLLESNNRDMELKIRRDDDMIKDMSTRLSQFERERERITPDDERLSKLMQLALQGPPSTEDEEVEITPLCDHEEDRSSNLTRGAREIQRMHWIIRHTGFRPLMCDFFREFKPSEPAVYFVDGVVSLKDDSGTNYTSYVRSTSRIRSTTLKKSLRVALSISEFSVICTSKSEMINSHHFQKIAEGVKSVNKNLSINMTCPTRNFTEITQMFLR